MWILHACRWFLNSLCLFVCLCVMVNIDGLIDQSKESLLFIRLNRNKQKTKHRWIYSCSILVSLIQLIRKMKWMDQLPYNSGVVCCSCCTCIDRVRESQYCFLATAYTVSKLTSVHSLVIHNIGLNWVNELSETRGHDSGLIIKQFSLFVQSSCWANELNECNLFIELRWWWWWYSPFPNNKQKVTEQLCFD